MGFLLNDTAFSAIFNGNKEASEKLKFDDVIKEIQNYLDGQDVPQAQALTDWMKEKHPLCGALVRQDVLENITNELYARRIPFLVASEGRGTGHSGILIRACDRDRYNRMRDDVLSQMSYLVYTVPASTLDDFVMAGAEDKKVVTLTGLQKEDAGAVINKSREMMGDTVIALDGMEDGTCRLSFNGKNFMEPEGEKRLSGMNQLLLETILNQHGFNKEKMKQAAKQKASFEQEFFSLFPAATEDDPAWIVGDSRLYLKVTDKGFEYGESRISTEGTLSFEKIKEVSRKERDFVYQLTSAIAAVKDPAVTYDAKKAEGHLRGTKPITVTLSDREMEMAAGERELAAAISKAYNRKAISEGIAENGNYEEQLSDFCHDASLLIKAAMSGERTPYGYSDRTMDHITAVCRDYRMNMADYKEACRVMESIDVSMYKAQPTLERSINFDQIMENDGLTRSERIRQIQQIKEKAMENGQKLDAKRYENQEKLKKGEEPDEGASAWQQDDE